MWWPLAMLLLAAAVGSAADRPAHHTDRGFQNVPPVPRPPISVALAFFAGRVAAHWQTQTGIPPVQHNDGAVLRANAGASGATVTWVGHATLLVQMDGVTFLTDPIWSDTASPVGWAGPRRFVPPGVDLAALPPIDFVVISHSHYDHLDLPTLQRLSNGHTRFLVPLRLGEALAAAGVGPVQELDWWDHLAIGAVTIHCVPTQHWSQRAVFDNDRTLWSGWAVVGASRRFYFAGDTGYFPGFAEIGRRLGPFDLAAVPIGAYAPPAMMRMHHMNPEEAVQAGLDLGGHRILGMHYGTFELTDEPLDEPPRRFHADGERRGLDLDRLWTPAVGETRWW
jgi:N-acyl-phosphatidylethanolamine-hydrolysing phospholipase D